MELPSPGGEIERDRAAPVATKPVNSHGFVSISCWAPLMYDPVGHVDPDQDLTFRIPRRDFTKGGFDPLGDLKVARQLSIHSELSPNRSVLCPKSSGRRRLDFENGVALRLL